MLMFKPFALIAACVLGLAAMVDPVAAACPVADKSSQISACSCIEPVARDRRLSPIITRKPRKPVPSGALGETSVVSVGRPNYNIVSSQ